MPEHERDVLIKIESQYGRSDLIHATYVGGDMYVCVSGRWEARISAQVICHEPLPEVKEPIDVSGKVEWCDGGDHPFKMGAEGAQRFNGGEWRRNELGKVVYVDQEYNFCADHRIGGGPFQHEPPTTPKAILPGETVESPRE